ncbi:MAG: hypothetical protein WBA93_18990 [Microcoleaceae cyanobacterium]
MTKRKFFHYFTDKKSAQAREIAEIIQQKVKELINIVVIFERNSIKLV